MIGSVTVHRDSLSLAALAIDGSGPYKVDDGGIPDTQVVWELVEAGSPWVEGSVEVHGVRGMVEQQMRIQVKDTSQTAVQADIGVLIAAFSQRSFVVDVVLNGATYSWSCRRSAFGMRFDRQTTFALISVVPVTFKRFPTPLAGPY